MRRDLLDEIIQKYRERRRKRLLERGKHGIINEDDKIDVNGDIHGSGDGRYKSKAEHATKSELERRLVGKKTKDGRLIKTIGDHLVSRCAMRGIHISSVVDTVFHGKRAKELEKKGRFVYIHRGTMVVLTPEGELMNAIYKGRGSNE